MLALLAGACAARGDASLRVAVMGSPGDPRIAAVREAVVYWNRQLERVRAHARLGPVAVIEASIPDQVLSDSSSDVMEGHRARGLGRWVEAVDADVVLSNADLVSFTLPGRRGGKAIVVLRRADVPPFSLPNVTRNAAAHELGHVLGLDHNDDPTTLMCGRPAPCRPDLFASKTERFFPLTLAEQSALRENWP